MALVPLLVLLGVPTARAADPVCAPNSAAVHSDDTVFGQDAVALSADTWAAAAPASAIGQ